MTIVNPSRKRRSIFGPRQSAVERRFFLGSEDDDTEDDDEPVSDDEAMESIDNDSDDESTEDDGDDEAIFDDGDDTDDDSEDDDTAREAHLATLRANERRLTAALSSPDLYDNERRELLASLNEVRQVIAQREQERIDLDWSAMHVAELAAPVATHSVHTAATDWLDEVTGYQEAGPEYFAHEAARWMREAGAAVLAADEDEWALQAHTQAQRVAGRIPGGADAFLAAVAKLATRQFTAGGERRTLILPYSEVCMHMGIAGKTVEGELVGEWMVQLYDANTGAPISFPITKGEAGWDMQITSAKTASDEEAPDEEQSGEAVGDADIIGVEDVPVFETGAPPVHPENAAAFSEEQSGLGVIGPNGTVSRKKNGSVEVKRIVLPYSEVCMHMGVSGKEMLAGLVGNMVQLYKDDGSLFSIPITRGEAGWDDQEDIIRSEEYRRNRTAAPDLRPFEQWMVNSNLQRIAEEGLVLADVVAELHANGYHRVADGVAERGRTATRHQADWRSGQPPCGRCGHALSSHYSDDRQVACKTCGCGSYSKMMSGGGSDWAKNLAHRAAHQAAQRRVAGNPYPVGTPNWFEWESDPDAPGSGPYDSGAPGGGIPISGPLTPEQEAWLYKGRPKAYERYKAEQSAIESNLKTKVAVEWPGTFTLNPDDERWIGHWADDQLDEVERYWSNEGAGSQPYMPGYEDEMIRLVRQERDRRRSASRKTAGGRFEWLWPGTRKPDSMVCHPFTSVGGGDTSEERIAQGSRSIVRFNINTGKGMANWKGSNSKHFMDLNPIMGAEEVTMPPEFLALALGNEFRSGESIAPGLIMAQRHQAADLMDGWEAETDASMPVPADYETFPGIEELFDEDTDPIITESSIASLFRI